MSVDRLIAYFLVNHAFHIQPDKSNHELLLMQVWLCLRLCRWTLDCPASFAYEIRVQTPFFICSNHFVQPIETALLGQLCLAGVHSASTVKVSLRGTHTSSLLTHFLQVVQNGQTSQPVRVLLRVDHLRRRRTNAHCQRERVNQFLADLDQIGYTGTSWTNRSLRDNQIVPFANASLLRRCDRPAFRPDLELYTNNVDERGPFSEMMKIIINQSKYIAFTYINKYINEQINKRIYKNLYGNPLGIYILFLKFRFIKMNY